MDRNLVSPAPPQLNCKTLFFIAFIVLLISIYTLFFGNINSDPSDLYIQERHSGINKEQITNFEINKDFINRVSTELSNLVNKF